LHATMRVVASRKADVQIRGVPLAVRDRLRRRAAENGLSMSQYVIRVLREDLARPTVAEWMSEVRRLPPLDLRGRSGATLVREGRRELGIDD
jgi:antitoxin FitA